MSSTCRGCKSFLTGYGVVGRPMPPRPLHYQLLLYGEIYVTEQIDMHLVWTTGRIFLKPIPRFLLEPHLWIDYLACVLDCLCSKEAGSRGFRECDRRRLWKSALGFLFSYAALVSHESHFSIAAAKHSLPVVTCRVGTNMEPSFRRPWTC
jgi:hypothetical protein